jgi:importin-9
MVKENYPGAVKQAVDDILPQWNDVFIALISVDVSHDLSRGERGWEGLAVRAEVFKV